MSYFCEHAKYILTIGLPLENWKYSHFSYLKNLLIIPVLDLMKSLVLKGVCLEDLRISITQLQYSDNKEPFLKYCI